MLEWRARIGLNRSERFANGPNVRARSRARAFPVWFQVSGCEYEGCVTMFGSCINIIEQKTTCPDLLNHWNTPHKIRQGLGGESTRGACAPDNDGTCAPAVLRVRAPHVRLVTVSAATC